jgi:hypothetical protein
MVKPSNRVGHVSYQMQLSASRCAKSAALKSRITPFASRPCHDYSVATTGLMIDNNG